MDIATAFKYRKLGYRIKRKDWALLFYVSPFNSYYIKLAPEDFEADDWEIMTANIVKHFPITYSND